MFETALIESRKRPQSKKRLLAVPIAIVFHVVVLVGVVAAQYWTIDPVPEPPIQVSFFQAAAPPPPPPPPAPPKPAAPKPQAVVKPAPVTPVQPVEIPEELPKPSTAPVEGAVEGVEGGVEGGVAGGVPGGVPGGVEGGVQDEILRVGGAITPPVGVDKPAPQYTELARKARIQGVVIVETIIDKDGNVSDVRVLKGLPMGLEQAAVEAVKRWKFKPAMLNGRPVSVYFTLTVNFRLQ